MSADSDALAEALHNSGVDQPGLKGKPSDIVERLRDLAERGGPPLFRMNRATAAHLLGAAADEIERLRGKEQDHLQMEHDLSHEAATQQASRDAVESRAARAEAERERFATVLHRVLDWLPEGYDNKEHGLPGRVAEARLFVNAALVEYEASGEGPIDDGGCGSVSAAPPFWARG